MLDLLFISSIIGTGIQLFKEASQKTIPAENWANKELYYKDMAEGVPIEQRMKNLEDGKYKLTKAHLETHPEPHRDSVSGKIIIENYGLYNEDLKNYGACQAQKWVKQGKYNLTPEEFAEEQKRIKAEYEYLYKL